MKWIGRGLGWALVLILAFGANAAAKQGYGTLSGVVLDPSGTPQMGATVFLISEDLGGRTVLRLLSNQYGVFVTHHVKPGKYAVRVTLVGYLPTIDRDVAVAADLTTMLRVRMDSVFASLDTLRRKSDTSAEPDDWKWVLRSATATRTILQWRDSDSPFSTVALNPENPGAERAHGIVQVTNGAVRFGSPSSLPDGPATAVSYDQSLGSLGRVLLAGQMSYLRGASGAFASIWLPSGTDDRGPETVFVLHQSTFGGNSLEYQEMRLDHTEQFALTDRLSLRAGAEYLRAGVGASASAFRPHAELDALLAPGWRASFVLASDPPLASMETDQPLESAIAELDTLPTVLFTGGTPVLEGDRHEEIGIQHKLNDRAHLDFAAFHDAAQHQAIFGSGPASTPIFAQDPFSGAYLYDGGSTSSWGARVAYHQALSDNIEFTAMYDYAGALTPIGDLNNPGSAGFQANIATRNHQSVAARISGKVPRTGTQVAASYQWISGPALSRLDTFGEALNSVDPNLHISLRQPLPGLNGRWVALADFSNVLAQGYIPASSGDSHIILVPVFRAFRGGVSFQF
ncbi:MAG: carboxypeptidase regulatory-like domain-containing protein [Candidatus Acidiferrales bacterium]